MNRTQKKTQRRSRIKKGIRKRVAGTAERPRLTVYRSNREIYAQIIDDERGVTLASASSRTFDKGGMTPVAQAAEVGKAVAQAAQGANVNQVVFDRNGYLYHGRVKALAEGAREGGLNF